MAVGLGHSTPPALLLKTLDAITQKYIVPIVGDNVFKPSPAFWALTKNGKRFAGGEIVYPLFTAENTQGGAYWGDQLLETAVVDTIQPANQLWRFYRQPVVIPVTDVILNRGAAGLDLVRLKFQEMSSSLLQKLSRALWDVSPQNTSLDIDSIVDWVKSTTNTIAGIDRSVAANAFWKPAANQALGGTFTPAQFESAYQSVVYGFDEPDILLTTHSMYQTLKLNFTTLVRFTGLEQDKQALQAGFRYHFLINNAVVVPDRFVPTGEGALLNSRYIYPTFHEGDYFTVDPFIKPSNQRVVVSTSYLAWQLICPSPRMNVYFTGGPS